MKNRFLTIGATLAAVTLALTGCGGGKTAGPDSGGDAGGSISSGMIFGGPPEFKTRPDGIPGLKRVYNVEFGQYKVTDVGGPVTVNALTRGQVDAADLFTTDPSISANGFVVLEDDQSMFAAQNIVPIIAKDKNTPAVSEILNGIQAKLTTDGLMEMLDHAYNDKTDAADLATQWLSDNGLDDTGSDAKGVSLTVGSANFPENEILAEIYAQALSNHGATITKKLNIGSREKYLPALKSGSLSLFPEYNGTLLSFLDANADATSTEEVDAALKDALPSTLESLDSAEAQDSDAIVVTQETADKYGLTTIGDLAKSAS
jgi:glycine betaine/choline ABC-type transport system substrate-binding protein